MSAFSGCNTACWSHELWGAACPSQWHACTLPPICSLCCLSCAGGTGSRPQPPSLSTLSASAPSPIAASVDQPADNLNLASPSAPSEGQFSGSPGGQLPDHPQAKASCSTQSLQGLGANDSDGSDESDEGEEPAEVREAMGKVGHRRVLLESMGSIGTFCMVSQ